VKIIPGTRAATLYGAETALEDYRCNYGVNPAYHEALEHDGLRLSGFGENGELRVVELPTHPFFIATLFLPQMRSAPRRPHPILAGFAAAVATRTATQSEPGPQALVSRRADAGTG